MKSMMKDSKYWHQFSVMMGLKEGQVIWVEAKQLNMLIRNRYWPAKFSKTSNLQNILIVQPYPHPDILIPKGAEFVVQLESIKQFQDYKPDFKDEQFQHVYNQALKDMTEFTKHLANIPEAKSGLGTAEELCDYFEQLFFDYTLNPELNIGASYYLKELIEDELPLSPKDLITYMQRRTPQLLSYLSDCCNFDSNPRLKTVIESLRNRIISSIITALCQSESLSI